MRFFLSLVLASFFLTACAGEQNNKEQVSHAGLKVIYGEDNRMDWFENTSSELNQLAQSTVALVKANKVIIKDNDQAEIKTSSHNLCKSEAFYGQEKGAFCSGFLIAPNLIVTAGHCIKSQSACNTTKFIFDYAIKSPQENPKFIKASDVYSCKKLIAREQVSTGADWAVIEIDRVAENRTPLSYRKEGKPNVNDELTLIGHPSGLPSKIATGAKVRSLKSNHFVANVDAYGGNSGSAVFNSQTGEVEGILVRGASDYRYKGGCKVSNVCSESGCRGEDVTYISEVFAHLPNAPHTEEEPKSPTQEEPTTTEPNTEASPYASYVRLPIRDSLSFPTLSKIKNVPTLVDVSDLKVKVKIRHPYMKDLFISLIAPNGNEIVLQNRRLHPNGELDLVYGQDRSPWQPFVSLGSQPAGTWTLSILDVIYIDEGELLEWELILP